jgi:hypothetical protein
MEFLFTNKSINPIKVSKLNANSVDDALIILNEKGILDFDLYLNIKDKDIPNIASFEQTGEAITLQSLPQDKINSKKESQTMSTLFSNITFQEKPIKKIMKKIILILIILILLALFKGFIIINEWAENGLLIKQDAEGNTIETNMKDGKPDGLTIIWDKNGKKISEINYKDGVVQDTE